MDAISTSDPRLTEKMIYLHLLRMRNHPLYKDAVIYLLPESGGNYIEAQRIALIGEKPELQPLIVVSRDSTGNHRPGVPTGPVEKILYVAALNRALFSESLHFAEDQIPTFLAKTPDTPGPVDKIRKVFFDQLARYHRAYVCPKEDHGERYKSYMTGKMKGFPDDVQMVIQMTHSYMNEHFMDPSFQRTARSHGWTF